MAGILDDLEDLWVLASHADVHVTALCSLAAIVAVTVLLTLHFMRRPRPVYLLNYAVYKPPDSWKSSHQNFLDNSERCGVRFHGPAILPEPALTRGQSLFWLPRIALWVGLPLGRALVWMPKQRGCPH
jgi:3-ketoacyl-CoA synthase